MGYNGLAGVVSVGGIYLASAHALLRRSEAPPAAQTDAAGRGIPAAR